MVMQMVMYVGSMWPVFYFYFTGRYNWESATSLWRDFKLWNLKRHWDCIRLWGLLKLNLLCFFCIIWLQECRWFESEWPLKAHIFQFLVIRFWHNFRGVKRCVLTLLKGRCGHVGERVSMEVGFVVSKASARLSMSQFLPLEGPIALSYSTSYCLHSTKLPVMMVMD